LKIRVPGTEKTSREIRSIRQRQRKITKKIQSDHIRPLAHHQKIKPANHGHRRRNTS
jgi:hypothetical protein